MRDTYALGADCLLLVLVTAALWLATYYRGLMSIIIGCVAIAGLAGMTALRALPVPTRLSLEQTVASLKGEEARLADALRGSKAELVRAQDQCHRDIEQARLDAKSEADRLSTDRLMGLMKSDLATKYYQAELLPEREWINGKVGSYFVVRLLDDGKAFVFPKGHYRVTEKEEAVRRSYKEFANQVLTAIPASFEPQVFVRGGADVEPFIATEGFGNEFGAIRFRRLGEDGKFGAPTDPAAFPPTVNNEDLPLLRAAYFRTLLDNDSPPELLHKKPSESDSDAERTVDIIVYIQR